jgi:hypothetical protein
MGRRLSNGEEMSNLRHLGDFREYWRESVAYPHKNFGNDRIHMPVDVVYEWGNGKSQVRFSSEFRAFVGSGPADGKVDIDDTSKIRIEDFHLQFSPAFQNYFYDATDKTLIISDSSPKMGGKYWVIIRPSIEEP